MVCNVRAALLALSFLMLHTSSMVVAFAGAESGKLIHRFGPSTVHLIAALMVRSFDCFGECLPAAQAFDCVTQTGNISDPCCSLHVSP